MRQHTGYVRGFDAYETQAPLDFHYHPEERRVRLRHLERGSDGIHGQHRPSGRPIANSRGRETRLVCLLAWNRPTKRFYGAPPRKQFGRTTIRTKHWFCVRFENPVNASALPVGCTTAGGKWTFLPAQFCRHCTRRQKTSKRPWPSHNRISLRLR